MSERLQTTESLEVILSRLRREAEDSRLQAATAKDEVERKQHLADVRDAEKHIRNLETSLR